MEDENVAVTLCLIIIASAALRIRRDRRRPRQWTRAWIRKRRQLGAYHSLMKELASEDPQSYRNVIRMDTQDFDELLTRVTPFIQKQDTRMRESISPAERLSLTLRYLATGDSYHSLSYLYRVPVPTLSEIIPETFHALYHCLQEDYMKVPNSVTDWECVEEAFKNKWNFPNCVGAMDGKHVSVKCPVNSGSLFYNYKQFYSMVLFAFVDADYKFLYVDVGRNGRMSDGGNPASKPQSRGLYTPAEYLDRENPDTCDMTQTERRQFGTGMAGLPPQGGNRTTLQAREVRDELCDYFNSDGPVPWQWKAV